MFDFDESGRNCRKNNDVGHKWLGCFLSAGAYGRSTLDTTYHLQAASRAFFANKQILCDKKVRLAVRLRFFDRVITPVALFAFGHRTIRMIDLYQMDITFRKLLRAMVGPPPGIDWSCDWHVILHSWNDRVQRFTNLFRIKTWSRRCVEHYWKSGRYAANLPPERWISRVLAWNPLGRRRSGCPRTSWPNKFISYTRYRHFGNWQVLARDPDLWRGLMDDFCMFCGRGSETP